MAILEAKVDALVRLALAEDPAEHHIALAQLKKLADGEVPRKTVEEEITGLLLELGVPERNLGYERLVAAIQLLIEEPQLLHQLSGEDGLYAKVAGYVGSTHVKGVERSMRLCIESTWSNGDPEVLYRFFGNTVSPRSGRPTVSGFLARVAREIRQKMGGWGYAEY